MLWPALQLTRGGDKQLSNYAHVHVIQMVYSFNLLIILSCDNSGTTSALVISITLLQVTQPFDVTLEIFIHIT